MQTDPSISETKTIEDPPPLCGCKLRGPRGYRARCVLLPEHSEPHLPAEEAVAAGHAQELPRKKKKLTKFRKALLNWKPALPKGPTKAKPLTVETNDVSEPDEPVRKNHAVKIRVLHAGKFSETLMVRVSKLTSKGVYGHILDEPHHKEHKLKRGQFVWFLYEGIFDHFPKVAYHGYNYYLDGQKKSGL